MTESKLHLVQLDSNIMNGRRNDDNCPHILYGNIKHNRFMGYLVNQSASTLYFEPEDHNGLIIVPHAWIKWCVPVEETEELTSNTVKDCNDCKYYTVCCTHPHREECNYHELWTPDWYGEEVEK